MRDWELDVNNLHIVANPVNEVRSLSVDSGVSSLGTAVPPGHNTRELASTHEGAARVSLAGVLASLGEPSADHGVVDRAGAIGVTAVIVRDNGDIHLLEDSAEAASLAGGSPASDGAHGAVRVLFSWAGQADGADVGAGEVGTVGKLQDTDVIGNGPAIIALVEDYFGDSDVSLVFILIIQVLASNTDSKTRGRLSSKKIVCFYAINEYAALKLRD